MSFNILQHETTATYLDFSGNSLGAFSYGYVLRMLADNHNFTELVRNNYVYISFCIFLFTVLAIEFRVSPRVKISHVQGKLDFTQTYIRIFIFKFSFPKPQDLEFRQLALTSGPQQSLFKTWPRFKIGPTLGEKLKYLLVRNLKA